MAADHRSLFEFRNRQTETKTINTDAIQSEIIFTYTQAKYRLIFCNYDRTACAQILLMLRKEQAGTRLDYSLTTLPGDLLSHTGYLHIIMLQHEVSRVNETTNLLT